jgi:hypothetical protein
MYVEPYFHIFFKIVTESELALKEMEKWEKRVKETAEYDQVICICI